MEKNNDIMDGQRQRGLSAHNPVLADNHFIFIIL